LILGEDNLEVTGLRGDGVLGNGIYTLFRELSVEDTDTCAYNPIYVGPVVGEFRTFFASFRPFAGLRAFDSVWVFLKGNSSHTLEENFRFLNVALSDVTTFVTDISLVFRSALFQSSFGVYLVSTEHNARIWDASELTDFYPVVPLLIGNIPSIVSGFQSVDIRTE
jgi:hypothetical protein